ncbi:gp206 [Sphingomonas phage PAU]|uniref:NAD-dependent DNA ligase n=1 Tax=Sphingomonas phage PAU TaxID=1150991 RepID=UPI000257336C|nr:NAD-dependent DNA ligase [Sphingomonas phage PAU]AFF28204.1 gp206 [Sphingomonas phage PAU]
MQFEKHSVQFLIDLYNNAKEQYYNTGNSPLTDSEFDELEDYLLSNEYVEKYVGTEEIKGTKSPHVTPMLSLDKVQVFTDGFEGHHFDHVLAALGRYDQFVTHKHGDHMLQASFKLDGLAANITYADGVLKTIATRGNGKIGSDITEKCKHLVPNKLSTNFSGEVRGEIFIKKSTFIQKYSEYKNPRNLAAGIVGQNDIKDPRLKDLNIFLFEVKGSVKTLFEIVDLRPLIIDSISFFNTFDEMSKAYHELLDKRTNLDYPTDGIVIRLSSAVEHRDNGLAPLYSVAVKFPPMLARTKIAKISWNLRKSGKFIPHATLEPVELDGTIVTHAALHNYGWVNERGCWEGAEVVIGKNGDIIPQIQSVVTKSEPSNLPENHVISDNGLHMLPSGDMSDVINRNKFVQGFYTLGMFGFGGATFIKLYDLMEGKIENIFNDDLFTKKNLAPILGLGMTGPKFLKERQHVLVNMNLPKLLLAMQFDSCGWRHCLKLSKAYSKPDAELDTSGLNSKVVYSVTQDQNNIYRITSAIQLALRNGIELEDIEEKVIEKGSVTFEMTGSPKLAGFKSKEAFVQYVSTWNHTKLKKDTTYLITDDKVSKTSKMKFADANNVTVLTYEEAVAKFKESL